MQSEEERLRDQREREQLERNIRERDTAATRKVKFSSEEFWFVPSELKLIESCIFKSFIDIMQNFELGLIP